MENDDNGGLEPAEIKLLFRVRHQLKGLDSLILFLRLQNDTHKKISKIIGCSQYYVFCRLKKINRIIRENPELKELWGKMNKK